MRLKLFASFLARFSSRYSSCGDAQAVERASTIKRKTSILRRLAPAATNRGVLHFSPVESKVARYMLENNLSNATLVLNNHPCSGPLSCSQWLEKVLPQGSSLRVIVPDGFDMRGSFDQIFTGK